MNGFKKARDKELAKQAKLHAPYDVHWFDGTEWAIKYILSTDAIVSMHDALMGHHPVPDALAKWDNLIDTINQE